MAKGEREGRGREEGALQVAVEAVTRTRTIWGVIKCVHHGGPPSNDGHNASGRI